MSSLVKTRGMKRLRAAVSVGADGTLVEPARRQHRSRSVGSLRTRLLDFLASLGGPNEQAWLESLGPAERRAPGRLVYCLLLKRWFDLALASLLLVCLAPLLLAVALALKLQSAEPAIFRQARVGRHGRPFVLYKFRTMIPDRRMTNGP